MKPLSSRSAALGAAFAAAAVGLALSAGATAARPPARTVIRDRADASGPLDLARVAVGQKGRGLVVAFRVRGQILGRYLEPLPKPGARTPHYLCLGFHRNGAPGSRRLCLGRAGSGRWRAGTERIGAAGKLKHAHRIGVRMLAVHGNRIRARVAPGAVGLPVGGYRVHAESAWSGRACGKRSPCRDRAPSGRNARFRLRPLRLAGCSRSGVGLTYNGPPGHGEAALTFDDGPSIYTPKVLSILNRYHVHATFFEIGEQVSGNQAIMNRILDSGDEIGDHTEHHVPNPGYTEIASAQRRIKDATGFRTCLFRPPDGVFNSGSVAAAKRLGMSTIIWNVDPRDWSRPGTSAIYSRVTSATRAGSIVIMHDGGGDRSETVAALPGIIRTLKKRGLRLVTVSQLLAQPMRFRPVG